MTNRGQPGQIGTVAKSAPGLRDPVLDRLDALERSVRELATARSGNYTTVTGTLDVEGTLDVTGNAIIGGTLSLPNGIINNAALANPLAVDWIYSENNAVGALSTFVSSPPLLHSATFTARDTFPAAQVMVVATVAAQNSTGTNNTLWVAAAVDGALSTSIVQGVFAGGWGSAVSIIVYPLGPFTPGQLITVEAHGGASATGLINGNAHITSQIIYYNP